MPPTIMSTTSTDLPPGCAATPAEVTIGGTIYAMDATNGVVTAHSIDAAARTVFVAGDRKQVTQELRDRVREQLTNSSFLATVPPDTIANVLQRGLPVGALLPPWTGMIGDPSGRLWLRTEECGGPVAELRTHEIITTAGEPLATIDIPTAWSIQAVRGERVLVVRRNDLGVEHLEMYTIR
jgi:hypothetical protein